MKAILFSSFLAACAAGSAIASPLPNLYPRRFGQQNPPVQGEIGGLPFAQPGLGGTLGGRVPSTLLGAADPCDKLRLADEVITSGDAANPAFLAAAAKLVHAEQNFNPLNGAGRPKFCADPALPATAALRGVLPFISPEDNLQGADAYNAKAVASLQSVLGGTTIPADGKSIEQLVVEAGFTDFAGAPGNGGNTGGQAPPPAPAPTEAPPAPPAPAPPAPAPPASGNLGSCQASAAQLRVALGADPEGERAQEVRFVPGGFQTDPIFGGQASALNPAIVANFICDRLGDQCQAAADTVTACRAGQAAIVAANLRGGKNLDAATLQSLGKLADDFNAAIGIQTNFATELPGGGNGGNTGGQVTALPVPTPTTPSNIETVIVTVTTIATVTVDPAARPTSDPTPPPAAPAGGNVLFQPDSVEGLTFDPLLRSTNPQRQFQVAQDTFVGVGAACGRVGDRLFNKCANKLNGEGRGNELNLCATARDAAKAACPQAAQSV
ncbi:hypothetical protein HDU85_003756 [Gaertneriomyces sp. JEL0708]|nr:hypothetical protein HDU85_003756 [Gaertneriomyces sp. JEL0708]